MRDKECGGLHAQVEPGDPASRCACVSRENCSVSLLATCVAGSVRSWSVSRRRKGQLVVRECLVELVAVW